MTTSPDTRDGSFVAGLKGLKDPLDILFKIITILVTIGIFLLGQQYTKRQKAREEEQKKLDRVTALLPYLSSDKDRSQIFGIAVANELNKRGELPNGLLAVLLKIYEENGPSSDVGGAAATLLNSTISNPKVPEETREEVRKALSQPSGNVIIRRPVGSEALATSLAGKLGTRQVNVSRDVLESAPARSELHYFRPQDKPAADSVARVLKAEGTTVQVKDLSNVVQRKGVQIPARQFELQLAKRAATTPPPGP